MLMTGIPAAEFSVSRTSHSGCDVSERGKEETEEKEGRRRKMQEDAARRRFKKGGVTGGGGLLKGDGCFHKAIRRRFGGKCLAGLNKTGRRSCSG
jgi:hypothetical protein